MTAEGLTRRAALAAPLLGLAGPSSAQALDDPLPSWKAGAVKRDIVQFAEAAAAEGGEDFVPPHERLALFDDDGTLWCERPVCFQYAFAVDRIRAMALRRPEWKTQDPFRTLLESDLDRLGSVIDQKTVAEMLAVTHAGMTTDEFAASVTDWMASAKHSRFGRRYEELVYAPMRELVSYLRGLEFKVFVLSGGDVDFMRPWVERVYGIPPEQVIGSSGRTLLEDGPDGKPRLVRLAETEFVVDGPGRPVGIHRFLGRRPLVAFGNSDGDLEMLRWTDVGPVDRFIGLVRHTDETREYAYDRQSKVARLDKALDEAGRRGWTVIDMKRDWKRVFAFEPPPAAAPPGSDK